jgi:hypothetical protein
MPGGVFRTNRQVRLAVGLVATWTPTHLARMSRPMPLHRASLCLLVGATLAEAQPSPRTASPDDRPDMLVGTVVDAMMTATSSP